MAPIKDELQLDGDWQIAFDPGNKGLNQGWMCGNWPETLAEKTQVPGIWGITHPEADGIGFYRRTFTIPSAWEGRVVLLKFEGASYKKEVWVNHQYVGSHEGAYTPFYFDVTSHLHPGQENELVVRVSALSKSHPVDGMELIQSPASKQVWYYTYGGLWGSVRLETAAWITFQSIHASPDLQRKRVEVEIALNNRTSASQPIDLTLQIAGADGREVVSQKSEIWAHPGVTRFFYPISIPTPIPWSCNQPHLYRLRVTITGEQGEIDQSVVNFGMRDFTVQNGQFFLNGEPIFLRSILLQPNYPITLVQPSDPELIVRELTLAKEAGFNMVRIHIRPASPVLLDLADQMGLLVYAESCLAWIRESPRMYDHGRREIQAMVERDRNHPSIVFWGVYNENPPAAALYSETLMHYLRSLDPTRVVVNNSGGSLAIDQDFGWIDRALVIPNRETQPQPIQDIHLYLGGLISNPVYEWLQGLGSGVPGSNLTGQDIGIEPVLEEFERETRAYRGQYFVSELGGGGIADLDETVQGFGDQSMLVDARELGAFRASLHEGFERRQLDKIFGSARNLTLQAQELQARGDTRQIEALLTSPRVSGYGLTQLNDCSWEFHAGLLDLWRNPKPAYFAVKRLNQPFCVILKSNHPAIQSGETALVKVKLLSQSDLPPEGELLVTIMNPEGHEISSHQLSTPGGSRQGNLEDLALQLDGSPGEYQVEAVWTCNQKELARSTEVITVVEPVAWEGIPPGLSVLGELPGSLQSQPDQDLPEPGRDIAVLILAGQPGSLTPNDWDELFNAVKQGSTAIIGALHPKNDLALRRLAEQGIPIQLHASIGSWMGCYHWIPESELFGGLPSKRLAGEAYIDVIPHYSLGELGAQIYAGAFRNTQTMTEPSAMIWYSDIEAFPYGKGKLVFCQYRVFDKYQDDPVGGRLAYNLIRSFTSPDQNKA